MAAATDSPGYPRKRARTRRRLLRAAMDVIAERGSDATTVGLVAARAGVAPGTVYNHFPAIEDLLADLSGVLATGIEIGKVELDSVEHDAAVRVATGTLQLLTLADDDPAAAAAFVGLMGSRPAFRQQVRAVVGGAIDDGVVTGRFDVPEGSAATDAVLGTVLQSMRTRLRHEHLTSTPTDTTALVVRVLGVPGVEIADVVERATTIARSGGIIDRDDALAARRAALRP